MIELTVALPVWNSKKIVWLALESLCRQRDISFNWELIVCEEQDENGFGVENYLKYKDRLKHVGCVNLKVIPLKKWISLGQKYYKIIQNSNVNSKALLLQAADCYSQPFRLNESYQKIVKNNYDWVCYKIGAFIDLHSWNHILYNDLSKQQKAGLNMAFCMKSARKLPNEERKKLVDGWLYNNLNIKNPCDIDPKHWKLGVDTHGLNNISKSRQKYFKKEKHPFYKTDYKVDYYLPKDVVERLKML